jgi:hypothetical protein
MTGKAASDTSDRLLTMAPLERLSNGETPVPLPVLEFTAERVW